MVAVSAAADHYRKAARLLPTAETSNGTDTIADNHTLEQQLIIDEMNACVREVIDQKGTKKGSVTNDYHS